MLYLFLVSVKFTQFVPKLYEKLDPDSFHTSLQELDEMDLFHVSWRIVS